MPSSKRQREIHTISRSPSRSREALRSPDNKHFSAATLSHKNTPPNSLRNNTPPYSTGSSSFLPLRPLTSQMSISAPIPASKFLSRPRRSYSHQQLHCQASTICPNRKETSLVAKRISYDHFLLGKRSRLQIYRLLSLVAHLLLLVW